MAMCRSLASLAFMLGVSPCLAFVLPELLLPQQQLATLDSPFPAPPNRTLPPLVYLSGLTASTLMADLKHVPLCNDTTIAEPLKIWPLTANITAKEGLCLLEVLKVYYNPLTKKFYNAPGAKVDVVQFGNMSGLTFGDLIATILSNGTGYEVGHNLFGAPFDWRLTDAGQVNLLYPRLKALVEEAYQKTGLKVNLMAPSYGPQNTLGFLQQQTQEWKDKYISWFIAMSPVWSGTPIALQTLVGGIPGAGAGTSLYRSFAVEIPALYWLAPQAGDLPYLYPDDEALVSTPSKNYSAADVPVLLKDLGLGFKVPMLDQLVQKSCLSDFKPPGVNTFVTYGTDLGTLGTVHYDKDFEPNMFQMPNITSYRNATEGGDGVVPLRSSIRSMVWKDAFIKSGKVLLHKAYPKQAHATCLLPSNADSAAMDCFTDVFNLLFNGTIPSNLQL